MRDKLGILTSLSDKGSCKTYGLDFGQIDFFQISEGLYLLFEVNSSNIWTDEKALMPVEVLLWSHQ